MHGQNWNRKSSPATMMIVWVLIMAFGVLTLCGLWEMFFARAAEYESQTLSEFVSGPWLDDEITFSTSVAPIVTASRSPGDTIYVHFLGSKGDTIATWIIAKNFLEAW